jgi:MerR family copper efflux transcriptional regulator
MEEFSMGAVCRQTGYGPPTVRYFEAIGLLPPVPRSAAGRRVFRAEHVERLAFIRSCRTHGLTQKEIQSLVGLLEAPDEPCGEVTAIVSQHVARLKARMATLAELIAGLEAAVQTCDGSAVSRCRIVQSLNAGGERRI